MTGFTRKWLTFSPLLLICTTMLCFGSTAGGAGDGYTISVSQFIRHPALDALLRGFMEQLQDSRIPVRYSVHIANGDAALNEEITKHINTENPDLVLTLSTPSSQACYKNLRDRTILFSAVTDPIAAGLVESMTKPGLHIMNWYGKNGHSEKRGV